MPQRGDFYRGTHSQTLGGWVSVGGFSATATIIFKEVEGDVGYFDLNIVVDGEGILKNYSFELPCYNLKYNYDSDTQKIIIPLETEAQTHLSEDKGGGCRGLPWVDGEGPEMAPLSLDWVGIHDNVNHTITISCKVNFPGIDDFDFVLTKIDTSVPEDEVPDESIDIETIRGVVPELQKMVGEYKKIPVRISLPANFVTDSSGDQSFNEAVVDLTDQALREKLVPKTQSHSDPGLDGVMTDIIKLERGALHPTIRVGGWLIVDNKTGGPVEKFVPVRDVDDDRLQVEYVLVLYGDRKVPMWVPKSTVTRDSPVDNIRRQASIAGQAVSKEARRAKDVMTNPPYLKSWMGVIVLLVIVLIIYYFSKLIKSLEIFS